jgi:hypothetical protein
MGRSDFLHPTLRKEREGWGTLIVVMRRVGHPPGFGLGNQESWLTLYVHGKRHFDTCQGHLAYKTKN